MLWTTSGTDRACGGAFERQFLQLLVFGTDGLIIRSENFDADRAAEALARFDELTAAVPSARASRTPRRARSRASRTRGTRAIGAASRRSSRPAPGHSTGGAWSSSSWIGLQFLDFLRATFEMATSRYVSEVIATRGDRLALDHHLIEVRDGDIGATEIESLIVVELDERGERVATVRFDPGDLDAATAELDDRYAAGEAAAYPHVWGWMRDWGKTIATWDLDARAALVAPDHVVHDHRLFGWETAHGVAGMLEIYKSMLELAPDARFRVDHATISAHASLVVGAWIGTREGGAFEAPRIAVQEFDHASGRGCRLDLYDPGQLAEARACFAAVAARTPRDPLAAFARPNAATAVRDRLDAAFEARDWDAIRASARRM